MGKPGTAKKLQEDALLEPTDEPFYFLTYVRRATRSLVFVPLGNGPTREIIEAAGGTFKFRLFFEELPNTFLCVPCDRKYYEAADGEGSNLAPWPIPDREIFDWLRGIVRKSTIIN